MPAIYSTVGYRKLTPVIVLHRAAAKGWLPAGAPDPGERRRTVGMESVSSWERIERKRLR
jgi:hypothetical protein